MKRVIICIILITIIGINSLSLRGMLSRASTQGSRAALLTAQRNALLKHPLVLAPKMPVLQRRTVMTPSQLKGSYTPLTQEAKVVSPALGAKFESGALQRMYALESDAPAIRLIKELFYEQESQFKPTVNKSKAAYSLTPGVLGLVMGALESNKLQDQAVCNYIVEQWKAEYKRLTGEKKAFSETKIRELLSLIEAEYAQDKNNARSILLSFLYAKAVPDNNHDMIHYFAGLSEYMKVFEQQNHPIAQAVAAYRAQPKEKTFLEKIAAVVERLKNYFYYTPQEYAKARSQIKEDSDQDSKINTALGESFEVIISSIISQKQSEYPTKVVQSYYGYKDKPQRANCVEAATQDLLNIFLYNPQSRILDLSMLPSTVQLNQKFREFYQKYGAMDGINADSTGQAFMDLVSGIDGVHYVEGDYELDPVYAEKNFVILFNHFFGINAHNFNELSTMLSDERRTVNFVRAEDDKKITMHIRHNDIDKELQAAFCFSSGHGWIEAPDRDVQKLQDFLLNPNILIEKYNMSPEAQALFSVQPREEALDFIKGEISPSVYYAFKPEYDYQRAHIVRHILLYNKHNKEALDYAYKLYIQLSVDFQQELLAWVLKSGASDSHALFKEYIAQHPATLNPTMALQAQKNWKSAKKIKFLLDLGADPNGYYDSNPTWGRLEASPLVKAMWYGSLDVVELLLKQGASPNKPVENNPPIFSILRHQQFPELMVLLQRYGANINEVNHAGQTVLDYLDQNIQQYQNRRLSLYDVEVVGQLHKIHDKLVEFGAKKSTELQVSK